QTSGVGPRFTQDMPSDKLWGVLEHVNEAVQLPQDVVGNVAAGAGLAIEKDRDLCIAKPDLLDEVAEFADRGRILAASRDLLLVGCQVHCRVPLLLLSKSQQVAIIGRHNHLSALPHDRLGNRTDPQTRSALAAEISVADQDRKTELHLRFSVKRSGSENSGP